MNASENKSELETVEDVENNQFNTKLYVLASIIVLTLVGNSLILILVISKRESTMTRVHYFMLHLSVADVITAFLTLLPEFIWTLTAPYFYGGNFICKTVKYLQMVGPYLR